MSTDFYSLRVLVGQPVRFMLTVFGIALCIVLMLVLMGVYNGVEVGAMDYIRHNKTDFWILQRNSWNILRGTSLLSTGHGAILKQIPTIESASPVLLLLPGVETRGSVATVFLAGYEPDGRGGPPGLVMGEMPATFDQIVIDKAFAARMDLAVGDSVWINQEPLNVVGISTGTNAFVIQYAFVTLERAQYIAGFSTVVSCYLVKVRQGVSSDVAREDIENRLPGVEVYDHERFLSNNLKEMQSGLLPLLSVIAILGAVVLTAILSLLLSLSISERRRDYAVMKILGAPTLFLPRTIVFQAFLISAFASGAALIFFFPLCNLVQYIVPEMAIQSTVNQIFTVVGSVAAIGLLSSIISLRKLRKIYPLEVFA